LHGRAPRWRRPDGLRRKENGRSQEKNQSESHGLSQGEDLKRQVSHFRFGPIRIALQYAAR
jgi:hypothetical protein